MKVGPSRVRRFWDSLTVRRFVLIMCGFALVAIVLDVATSVLHGWLPNIGVGAISIAVTAVVVEGLLKLADHARFAGRVGA